MAHNPWFGLILMLAITVACGPDAPGAGEEAAETGPTNIPIYLLEGLPILPGSQVVSTGGSATTVETVTRTGVAPDTAASWYRRALIRDGWELLGDVRQPDGTVNLHARAADGQPVWLMIGKAQGPGSIVSVIAAVPDSS